MSEGVICQIFEMSRVVSSSYVLYHGSGTVPTITHVQALVLVHSDSQLHPDVVYRSVVRCRFRGTYVSPRTTKR